MNEKTVLSVDIGTTSLKAALSGVFSDEGIMVYASSRVPFECKENRRISECWLEALKTAVNEMRKSYTAHTERVDPFSRLSGICISGNGPTIVAKDGTTLLWNEPLSVEIPDTCKSLFVPRFLQFKAQYRDSWEKCDTVFSGPEYFIYRLTGKSVTVLPEERYSTAYWNTKSLYDAGFTALEQSKFPPFKLPGDCVGVVSKEAAIKMDGLLTAGLPVFCGVPDFIAGLIGTATLSPSRICDCAGSSEGINLCTKIPVYAKGVRTLPSVIEGLWNEAVLISESGVKFADYKKKEEAKFGKEMSYDEFVNYVFDTNQEEGIKIMSDIAYKVKDGIDTLRNAVMSAGLKVADKLLITGGQALNKRWMQLKCDILNMPLCVPTFEDAELTGDAVLARFGMGEYESIQEAADSLVRISTTYYPENWGAKE